jgi:AcrR family transcriptional regulator
MKIRLINCKRVSEMSKEHYHHGMLKRDLIAKGLQLLNKEGVEGFSLRKVAARCGVSHAAPYKHFKNKEELIVAITEEVVNAFQSSLAEVVGQYSDDPQTQLVELGKAYVRFMVEHPDYLEFLFLKGQKEPVVMTHDEIQHNFSTDCSFTIFKQTALNYLGSINSKSEDRTVDILTMWVVVHGLAVLLVKQNISYSGDYLDLVAKIFHEKLRFI